MTDAARGIHGFETREDQPLMSVITTREGEDYVRYYTEQAETRDEDVEGALALAGAWKDLEDWEEVEAELDRIRHSSPPSAPLNV